MPELSYDVVLYYDPVHSEKYFIKLLISCFPNINKTKATNLYLVAQTNGRCVVFSGHIEHAEHFSWLMSQYPLEIYENKMVAPPVIFEILDAMGKRIV